MNDLFLVSVMILTRNRDLRIIPHFISDDLNEACKLAQDLSLDEEMAVVHCGGQIFPKFFHSGQEVV